MFFLFCLPVQSVEIPIPSFMYPIDFFSSASQGEFVVGSHSINTWFDNVGQLHYDDTRFWLKTRRGQFNGIPQKKVFQFSFYVGPYGYSYGYEGVHVDYFLWDAQDRPHFTDSFSSYGHGSETYYHLNYFEYIWPEPEFTLNYLYTKDDYSFSDHIEYDSIETQYYFTRQGDYISCANHYSYHWIMVIFPPLCIYNYSFHLTSSNGYSKTYDDINLDGIIPRINATTGTCHFLRLENNGIYKLLFGENINSTLLYQSATGIEYMDFQPDPSDRLHIIWKEYWDILKYGILEGDSFSSQTLTLSEYQDNFKIVMNTKGDMLLYNKGKDGNLYIWTRYHDSNMWTQKTLSFNMSLKDGYINEEGGISLLGYESDSPVIHFCHSTTRGEPINYSEYTIESGEKIKHSFCEDGNFGFLVKNPDDTYYIFVNEPSFGPPPIPSTTWILY